MKEEDSESDESSSESNSDSESDDNMCLNMKHEELIRQMHEHCQMWKTQREYVQEKRDEGKNDFLYKVLWPLRHDILVADYMQNLDMPHFGIGQTVDAY